jgi:selenocysteine lyase/cysteine desulfurase
MKFSRRQAAAGLLGAEAAGGAASPGRAASPSPFTLNGQTIHMNAANIAAGFRSGFEAETRSALDEASNPAMENRAQFVALADGLRKRVAAQIGGAPDGVSLLRNCSEGNCTVVKGLRLRPGDEVVVGRENHESTSLGWLQRARLEGVVVRVAQHPLTPTSPRDVVEAFAAQITSKTRVVMISHVSNAAGLTMPVAEIGRLARSAGAWFHLDCAQSYGWLPLDVTAIGCDSMAASAQKWLMGPIGGGMLYIDPRRLDEVEALIPSHGYWRDGPARRDGQIFEQVGQCPDAKLANYAATLDAREAMGDPVIESRVRHLASTLRSRLKARDIEVVGDGSPALWGPVIGVLLRGDVVKTQAALWADHRLACSNKKVGDRTVLRLSPHIYNSEAELDRVADLLAKA